jgi:hypothetical protein
VDVHPRAADLIEVSYMEVPTLLVEVGARTGEPRSVQKLLGLFPMKGRRA